MRKMSDLSDEAAYLRVELLEALAEVQRLREELRALKDAFADAPSNAEQSADD